MKSFARLTSAVAVACLAPFILAQSSFDPDGNTGITITSITFPTTASPITQTGCPTVTETRELCTTCPIPACLALSTVTQSCGCPTPVPTVHLDFPCASGCSGIWCSTSYDIITASSCDEDGPSTTGEPTTTTLAPNGTVTTSTSFTLTVSTNAARKMRAPLRWW